MKCHHCGSCDNKVIESRDVADGEAIRRRRQCLKCEHRFTTYERLERPSLVVVKRDGTRQLFSREKLMDGLQHACEKTNVTSLQLESFVAKVERELYERGEPEVSSKDIGELVMTELPGLSEVAYVRFASVYRSFKDITGFEKELSKIRESKLETKSPPAKSQTAKQKSKKSS
ncbi:MAG TPA: transcriptional regulator NrdR [Candidatus Binatia bacterium]|nr:transcriptional regulator NrdR [Candidatus Binatia bacterium]